jgi:N-acetylgalactosamine-N,N'-diacetylbacillosaminyl-diphospho-undecaprenol 4-alpha-N-acetylgalactosaminyltransferase
MQNFKKKICLIVDSLSHGGAERVAASLSLELGKLDYQVSIICLRDEIQCFFQGELYNLGLNDSKIKIIKQVSKFLKFKNAYNNTNADILGISAQEVDFERSVFSSKFKNRKRIILEDLEYDTYFNLD